MSLLFDISDDSLFITDIPLDKSHSVGIQLDAFNFKYSNDTGKWETSFSTELIFDVLDYFNSRNIKYEIGKTLGNLIEQINTSNNQFEELKASAQRYKDGDISKRDQDFSQYLSTIHRPLREHQKKAAHHHYLVKNAANFSVPGAGKTSVILSVYSKLINDSSINCLFVVGPTASFYSWINEYEETLGHKAKYIILSGLDSKKRKNYYYLPPESRPDLYIISFQTLCNDIEHIINMFKMINNNIYFIVDEAHYIKKLGGPWANAVLQASKYAKQKCVLTGTPLPHSYKDLYNLFDILWPDISPIDHNTRVRINNLISTNRESEINDIVEEKIGPLFYRVRKSELGLGPQIFNDPITIPMKENEKFLYDSIMNRVKIFSRNDYLVERTALERLIRGRLIRLRQVVSYPKLLISAISDYNEELFDSQSRIAKTIYEYDDLEIPAKLELLIDMVKDFQKQGQKIVIWTNFIGTLKRILHDVKKIGYNADAIWGGVPIETDNYDDTKTREDIRKEFVDRDSGLDILIANPAACSESISLHKTCHNAIYYDLSFNCAQYIQSLDRIHRVGGSENVTVNYYFLQYKDSFENSIMNNLEEKRERMFNLIEKDYSIYSLDMFEEDDIDQKVYKLIIK